MAVALAGLRYACTPMAPKTARNPRGAGAPTKQTDDRAKRIVDALRAGNSRRAACASAGISDETLARWLEHSVDFAEAVMRAEADSELELVKIIRNAAAEDWKAAAHLLACRWPDTWAKRSQVVLTLRDEAALVAAELGLNAADILAEAERLTRQAHG